MGRGQWVIIHKTKEPEVWKDSEVFQGNPLALLQNLAYESPTPQLITAIQLPYVVVCRVDTQPMLTSILDVRERELMEVEPAFVQAYTPDGYARGMALLRSQNKSEKSAPEA